jgi:hypothetical protein
MVVIVGDVLERTQIKKSVVVAANVHGEELVKLHACGLEDAASKMYYKRPTMASLAERGKCFKGSSAVVCMAGEQAETIAPRDRS